jgi:hypothetical protein
VKETRSEKLEHFAINNKDQKKVLRKSIFKKIFGRTMGEMRPLTSLLTIFTAE